MLPVVRLGGGVSLPGEPHLLTPPASPAGVGTFQVWEEHVLLMPLTVYPFIILSPFLFLRRSCRPEDVEGRPKSFVPLQAGVSV